MAGLVLNSRSKLEEPSWPTPDSSLPVWSSMGQTHGSGAWYYYPGFAGGTAGRAIKIKMSSKTVAWEQLNADSTAVTDGVWNSGMTVTEAGGANADEWFNFYMDEADNKLYILTEDTGTNPRTLYLSSVNEAGTVTAIGNAQHGNQSMANGGFLGSIGGPMYRTGGDGSGNLRFPVFTPAGGSSAAGAPYRGAEVTVNITNGSLSYTNLLGDNYSSENINYGYGVIGPTSNNIIIQTYSIYSTTDPHSGLYGHLFNKSTGKHQHNISMTKGHVPWGSGFPIVMRWRGRYFFANYAYNRSKSMGFAEADMHNYADQMAEFYGLL